MRQLPVALVAAFILASCGATAGSLSPSTSPAPTPSTAAGTNGPVASPTTQPTPACPTDSPMSVDEYVAADPSCFGAADVQVAGWEGYPLGTDPGIDGVQPAWLGQTPSDAGLRGHLEGEPCMPACDEVVLGLHLDPASVLAFEDDSQWVIVRGHRQDPAAATCVWVAPEVPEDPAPTAPAQADVTATCNAAFVATAIQPADPPAAALASCPTTAVITVTEFKHAGMGCFRGKTLQIIGYADALPNIDFGLVVGLEPAWLFFPQDPLAALWSERPVANKEIGPTCQDAAANGPGTCSWMLVQYKPSSGIAFKPSHQWVIVTGHIADSLAATCRYAWPASWTDPKTPDSSARRRCRGSFVMTGIRPTAAPTG
ncbi:MAG TPA: hypothetical protein VF484_00445, partial [Candidatus Limnocylindrales bacterium]